MAGLDPAIHDFGRAKQDVDARVKPGHDEWMWLFLWRFEASRGEVLMEPGRP
jgi:hypothetical protein